MPNVSSLRLSSAALITGVGYLLTPTPFAEFYVWPHLVVGDSAEQTLTNISSHQTLFALGILAYLVSYVFDVIIAWSLYYLLRPVSSPLAFLAALFQLVYTAVGLSASLGLATVLRLVRSPQDMLLFGHASAVAQSRLLLLAFHSTWGLALCFFGVHLILIGYLAFRSGYIPKIIGVMLVFAGIGYVVQNINSYLFPDPDLEYVAVLLLGELVFMLWLLIRGWKIKEPVAAKA